MVQSTYLKSKKKYKVSFELPQDQAGEGRDVRVLGTFNDWSWDGGLKLTSSKKGYTGSTELGAGTYEFRYLIDGQHWVNDDSVSELVDSGHFSQNCSLNLDEVKEEKKPAKKSTAKKKESGDNVEAAKSAPASKPVTTPKKGEAEAEAEAKAKAGAKKSPAKKSTAKKKGDDLKKIEGIGPKIAGLLNKAGINSFKDLAKASEKQLADVLQEAGARFRLAKHDTWQEQAKLAAEGKTDELKKMQDELKGGRKK